MMREVVNMYQESGGDYVELDPSDDPFFDYVEPLLIG